MSAPDLPTHSTGCPPAPEAPVTPSDTASAEPAWTWTEEDVEAALQSAFWFDSHISEQLIGPYRGMHIAILDKQIIAADGDLNRLCRRLDAEWPTVPTFRLVIRYIPTVEESAPRKW
jgi:hypothetical protein